MNPQNAPSPSSSLPTFARIAVTGAGGLLGHALCSQLGSRALPIRTAQLDFRHPERVRKQVLAMAPQAVINCAAYTAVDLAESDQDTCFRVNSESVKQLALATQELAIPLVQISTDYVFCNSPLRRPLSETDPVAPRGVYAESKYQGELASQLNPQHLIVRTCGLYGRPPQESSRNFVLTMLRLAKDRPTLRVVDDQQCSPTYAIELASAVIHLLDRRAAGIYHVVNREGVTWCQFAKAIFEFAGLNNEVIPIRSEEYAAPAPRPAYSVLDVQKYASLSGPAMSTCLKAVRSFLATELGSAVS